MQFFNYVMRKVWLHQTRIGLSLYDVAGQGYLKESVRMHSSNAFTRQELSYRYIIISYKAVIIKSMENKVDGEFFFIGSCIYIAVILDFFFFFAGFRKLYSRTYSNTASGKSVCLAEFQSYFEQKLNDIINDIALISCTCTQNCYFTPCNIYKDKRIPKYDYNHGF